LPCLASTSGEPRCHHGTPLTRYLALLQSHDIDLHFFCWSFSKMMRGFVAIFKSNFRPEVRSVVNCSVAVTLSRFSTITITSTVPQIEPKHLHMNLSTIYLLNSSSNLSLAAQIILSRCFKIRARKRLQVSIFNSVSNSVSAFANQMVSKLFHFCTFTNPNWTNHMSISIRKTCSFQPCNLFQLLNN
jgi:hypothetical protein